VLPARNRLRRSRDFSTAIRFGDGCRRPTMVTHVHASGGSEPPRVGFVVGRSVGPAVSRNLVKRRLRHLVADRLQLLDPGSVLVVRALPGASTAGYRALSSDLDTALRRLLGREAGTS
jgi:ribonuclease P protein component